MKRATTGSSAAESVRSRRCVGFSILALLCVSIGLALSTPAQEESGDAPSKTSPDSPASGASSAAGGGGQGDDANAQAITIEDFEAVYAETDVTRAVDRGLRWLAANQLTEGSWLSPGYGKNTGIVSLVVMAFLARGEEPGRGEYGDTITRAVAWLLDQQRGGLIARDVSHGEMYSHGISTLCLGEVSGMVDDRSPGFERLGRVHRSAVDLILRAQDVPKDRWNHGGWRYTPSTDVADISVTGWQLLALRAAQEIGLPVPEKSIRKAVLYVTRCADSTGGFAYQPGGESTIARTGTGILALEICGEQGSAEARRGGEWLLRHPLEWKGPFFYYGAYYSAQAMYQLSGEFWRVWQPRTEGLLLEHQSEDGSWPMPPGTSQEAQAGPAYATAMAILSLAVEFRYLPIYQR